MKFFSFFIVAIFLYNTLIAQQSYSLDDCFNAALQNNIALKKDKNNIQNAFLDKKAAAYSLLPVVYANAEHIFSSGKNIDPVTNNFVRDNFSGGDFDVTLQLNIFSGFSALNFIKSNLYKVNASESGYQKEILETFSAVTLAYAKTVYVNDHVQSIKNNLSQTQNELEVVQEKIDVGKLSKSDFYTINTYYKTEQADLVQAQADSLNALNVLKYLVGLKNNSFTIKDIDSSVIKNVVGKEFKLQDVLENVLKKHPALLESIYEEKAAEMNLKAAKGNLLPQLSLTGNIFSNYNFSERNVNGDHLKFNRQLDNNFGKTAGVLLQIPLFNKYQSRLAIEKEKINIANLKLTEQETENDIVKNVQQLLNDFISSKKKYLLLAESLQQAELSYAAFEERHKLGYISLFELLQAKDQLYAQQTKASEAKYELYFKYKLIGLLLNI